MWASLPFLLVLWDFGVRPLRRMTAEGVNADFFDIQARALFHGHLDVPPESLGIEAFVVDGRHYMYFGPFLAILRMPILLVTDRLDGRLTALSMLVGWIVLAAAVIVLVRRVRRTLCGEAPVSRFEAIGLAAIVATVTGGSTIVYLASQPWVYHEVYIWSTALTVATVASLIAAWDDLATRRIARDVGAGACHDVDAEHRRVGDGPRPRRDGPVDRCIAPFDSPPRVRAVGRRRRSWC